MLATNGQDSTQLNRKVNREVDFALAHEAQLSQHNEEAGKRWFKVLHRKSPLMCNGPNCHIGAVFRF